MSISSCDHFDYIVVYEYPTNKDCPVCEMERQIAELDKEITELENKLEE